MKTIKLTLSLCFVLLLTFASRATVLLNDSLNYPYTDGSIEGQGKWFCFLPAVPAHNTFVTNNVLLMVQTTTNDSVATPTNGWPNTTEFNYASFRVNVSQLPTTTNGGYFCQLQNINDTNDCCHVFIDTKDTTVPGTYRLGIGNFSTAFSNLTPPVNYPQDLATNTWYTVVILFDTNQSDLTFVGSTLWVNPSEADYQSVVNGDVVSPGIGVGYVYGLDTTSSTNLLNIKISQIGFSPYITAGISNVMAATTFDEVNSTNPPAFGINPLSGTNYSGNPTTFYAVASGVDVTYQWFSTGHGQLSDGVNYTGSTSNTLTVNSLSVSDTYYCVATDAYGNSVPSLNAVETVITTPTAVFYPTNVVPVNLTNNLFTTATMNDPAQGTGPLYYQWYFAPTNTPNTFSPLSGQNGPVLSLNLADFTFQGNYYVVASNSISGGSIALGPTNNLTEIAPLVANMTQLHNLEISFTNQIGSNPGGTIIINPNNFTVNGYVAQYSGYGTSYSEYFIEDTSGLGVEVFLGGHGNTNTPPIGANVTIIGELEIFRSALEIAPSSQASITTNTSTPPIPFYPLLANSIFGDLATNGLGVNGLKYGDSLVTFTNVFIYGSKTGGAIANGGLFASNAANVLYFTINSPYDTVTNSTVFELFQPAYNYGIAPNLHPSPFALGTVPTHCYQLTGIYDDFSGAGEVIPSRWEDYVTNQPASFPIAATKSANAATVTWPALVGSTYSAYSSTNLNGPWTHAAYGLAYYPTNGVFTDTNKAPFKFYQLTTP